MIFIFLANQLTLITRYLFVVAKENYNSFQDLDKDMVSFFGLQDKETLGLKSVKMKVGLNYSLQFFIFIYLLVEKNKRVFKM